MSENNIDYTINPDVVLREEDLDGALLFNPDTNDVQILNSTGLFIWKLCKISQSFSSIIKAVKDSFDRVPEDKVEAEVREFIQSMTDSGFLGTSKNR